MGNITRDLKRIIGGMLQFGLTGFNLKNSSGTAQVRNAADNDFADIEVQDVLIHSGNASFYVRLIAPTLTGNIDVTLPSGSVVIAPFGVNYSKIISFNQATASPFTIDAAPPANGTLVYARVVVDTAAAGGAPTLSIGVSGTTARDMATSENNLKETGQYIIENFLSLGASPAAIIGTLVPNGQTFSGRIELNYRSA